MSSSIFSRSSFVPLFFCLLGFFGVADANATDLSSLASAIDFGSVQTVALAVGAGVVGILVTFVGIKAVWRLLRGA